MINEQEKFLAYEAIRQSGLTNMFDLKTVIDLADGQLGWLDCIFIMEHYGELKAKYCP